MSKYIGRKISVGIGKESSRGTAVAPTNWLPITAFNHEGKVENAYCEAAQNTIVDSFDAAVIKEWAEGGFDALIGIEGFGLILLSALGSVSSATAGGETVVYDHTYTLQESAQHQSLTLAVDQANGDKNYALAVVDSLSLTFEKNKILDYSVGMMSKKGASATLTPSFSAENKFRPQDFSVKVASNIAGLSGASAIADVKSLSLEISKNVEADDVLGDTEPTDFLNKQVNITGEMTLSYDVTTYENLVLNGTHQAMRIDLTNSDVTLGTATNPQLKIDLAKCVFEEVSFDRGLDNIVLHTVSFRAVYSLSDAKVGDIVLTNTTASY